MVLVLVVVGKCGNGSGGVFKCLWKVVPSVSMHASHRPALSTARGQVRKNASAFFRGPGGNRPARYVLPVFPRPTLPLPLAPASAGPFLGRRPRKQEAFAGLRVGFDESGLICRREGSTHPKPPRVADDEDQLPNLKLDVLSGWPTTWSCAVTNTYGHGHFGCPGQHRPEADALPEGSSSHAYMSANKMVIWSPKADLN